MARRPLPEGVSLPLHLRVWALGRLGAWARVGRAVMQRKPGAALLLLRSHFEQSKAEVRQITLHALFEAQGRVLAAR